ncbi:hypothetical protein HNQ08_003636 [Deinococcus humi]|uniref:Uncharacterized protein n=1 Tax=Deinococcus humi TaxID=662880 RepID=A0A7W8JX97_9DEIO|nr:hypothetical protein [Deinococcus humi]GGO38022.1 hypothetical protein GCM10008949_44030 [Deinococcus humi]
MPDVPRLSVTTGPSIRDALIDDTDHLWLSFDDGLWCWADIAGFVEQHLNRLAVPVRLDPSDRWLEWVLQRPEGRKSVPGIVVKVVSQQPLGWYRPLLLRGNVEDEGEISTRQLARALNLDSLELRHAALAHRVEVTSFVSRLNDLSMLIDRRTPAGAAAMLGAPWALRGRRPNMPTPWDAVRQGQIGLVEQLIAPS